MLILQKHFPWLELAESEKQFDYMLRTLSCSVCEDKMKGLCAGANLKGIELRKCRLAISLEWEPITETML